MGWMKSEIDTAMTLLRKRQKELYAALQEAHLTETQLSWEGVQSICDAIDDAVADVRTLANRECALAFALHTGEK
jgi:hypothetical protein